MTPEEFSNKLRASLTGEKAEKGESTKREATESDETLV